MKYSEAPSLEIENTPFYPYSLIEEAGKEINHAQKHFNEEFTLIRLGEGYVLKSDTVILDVRGFAASSESPLESQVRAFNKISSM